MSSLVFRHPEPIAIHDIYWVNGQLFYITAKRNVIYRSTGKSIYKSKKRLEQVIYCFRHQKFIVWEGDQILGVTLGGKIKLICKVPEETGIMVVDKHGVIYLLNYKMTSITTITMKGKVQEKEFTELNFQKFNVLHKAFSSRIDNEIFLFDGLNDILSKVNLVTGNITFFIHEQMLPIYNINGLTVDSNDCIYLCGDGGFEIIKVTGIGKWSIVYRDENLSPECLSWKGDKLLIGTSNGEIIQVTPYMTNTLPSIQDLSIYELHRLKEMINRQINNFHSMVI